MPFKLPDEQKRYRWNLSADGLPVGKVERWGNIPYLLVCPLCGMLHEIRGGSTLTIGEFEPACIVKQTHKTVYAEWIAKYPQAADYRRVTLLAPPIQTPNIIPLLSQTPTVSTNRKAA